MSLLDNAQALAILDLIDPASADFVFPNWKSQLDNVRCFRVVGLEPVLQAHGVTHAHIFQTKEYITTALARVPSAWLSDYPTKDRGWIDRKRDQFSNAFFTRPIRLDKACVSILAACAALDRVGAKPAAFFQHVRILPQIYFVDGFTEEFYGDFVKGTPLENEILNDMNLAQALHLEKIAKRHCVTKQSAEMLYDMLHDRFRVIRNVSRERKKPLILLDEVINYNPAAGAGAGAGVALPAAAAQP